MKKKLRMIQVGVSHEHALGKFTTLKSMKDTFEVIGVVDDNDFALTPRFIGADEFESYKGERFITLDQALNEEKPDGVLIEVPNLDLVPVATMFAEKGIPMHMDKPGGEDQAAYKKLLDLCEEKHLPFQMGYMFRANPAIRFIIEGIKNGMLGSVFEIQANMNHCYGGTEYNDHYLPSFKGGIMFNLGCHIIDYIVAMLGRPEHVHPFLKSACPEDHSFNNCAVVLEYPHTNAIVTVCSRDSGVKRRLRIGGTKGTLEFSPVERFDGKEIEVNLVLKEPYGEYKAGGHILKFGPVLDRYEAQLQDFAAMIRGEKEDEYSRAHDYTVHEVILAASGIIKI
ncbi:MAG: Gfo/Idh/MocA family oxidoreductase [Lentisphaeria bacterium]|nr:Gfo/Idh/MocA family oxidoreductase [Lentisphaeria bacterium]